MLGLALPLVSKTGGVFSGRRALGLGLWGFCVAVCPCSPGLELGAVQAQLGASELGCLNPSGGADRGCPKPWGPRKPAVMLGPRLQALLVYSIVKYQPSEYGSYRFPAWAELLGILMGLLSCLMIPAGMLVAVLREEGSLWEVGLPRPCLPLAFPTWGRPRAHLLEQKTSAPAPYPGPSRPFQPVP